MSVIDMSDKKFGMLQVISRVGSEKGKKGSALWLCRCDCGNEIKIRGYSLRNGITKSYGCNRGWNLVTHGLSDKL